MKNTTSWLSIIAAAGEKWNAEVVPALALSTGLAYAIPKALIALLSVLCLPYGFQP
jgi:hypothetical protein